MRTNIASRRVFIIAVTAGLLLAASGALAQTLPGLWGSALYRVELSVSGTTVTGTFTPADTPQAPPGTISGRLQPDKRSFLADWGNPAASGGGTFKTLLLLDQRGQLLRGYRWDDETDPTHFALHRAVNGQIPEPVGLDDTGESPAAPSTAAPVGAARVALVARVCLANLEVLALAMRQYAADHLGRLPDSARWMDEIEPYILDPDWRCPAAPQLRYGYAMNVALSGVSRETVTDPRRTILLFESNLGTRNARGTPADAAQPPRHDGVNHCAYADMHCARFVAEPGAVASGAPVTPTAPVTPANPLPPATPVPAAKPAATVVICQRVDEQKRPLDPATVLAGPAGAAGAPGKPGSPGATPDFVLAVSTLTNIPVGSAIECVWKRDGKEFSRNRSVYVAGGRGYVWKWGPQQGGLPAGNYEVVVLCGGQELARQPFQIVAGPRGPNGPTAPVTPTNPITPATQLPAVQPAATLVMCRRVDPQLGPVGAGASVFTAPPPTAGPQDDSVVAVLTYSGMAVGSSWECLWKCDGTVVVRHPHTIAGPEDRGVAIRWNPQKLALKPGNYEVCVNYAGRELARQQFRVVATPSGSAASSAPAAPPASLPPTAAFPADTLNGLQIMYAVAGATLDAPTETGGTVPALSFQGKLTGDVLTVSGAVKGAGGEGADVTVLVWSRARREEKRFFVKNEGYHAPATPYSVSLSVKPGDGPGGFSIRVDGRFAPGISGVRGLLVTGQLAPR